MHSRLTLHFQSLPGWSKEFCERALRNGGEMYVKVMNPPEQNPFEGLPVRTIGRVHPDDNGPAKACQRDGVLGGRRWFDFWRQFMAKRAWVYAWESPNEPQPMQDLSFVDALDWFLCEWADRMQAAGFRTVGPNLGVGWPFLGFPGDPRSDVPTLRCAFDALDYWSLHEYGWPQMWADEGYHCLRYRETLKQLGQLGIARRPVMITECGLDGLLVGPAPRGWRDQDPPLSFESYLGQLTWYDQRLAEDNVLFGAIFNAPGEGTWKTYELRQEEAWRLADYIAMYPPAWDPVPVTPHVAHPSPEDSYTVQKVTPDALSTFTPPIVNMIGRLPTYEKVQPDQELQPFRQREVEDIKHVVVHHSAGMQRPPGDIKRWIRRVARWQIRKYGWDGLAYHAVVDADGTIYMTNDVKAATHHCGNWDMNGESVALLLLGTFSHGEDVPTDAQLASAKWYVQKLGHRVLAHKRVPHPKAGRKWVATACPGDLRAKWWKELKEASH